MQTKALHTITTTGASMVNTNPIQQHQSFLQATKCNNITQIMGSSESELLLSTSNPYLAPNQTTPNITPCLILQNCHMIPITCNQAKPNCQPHPGTHRNDILYIVICKPGPLGCAEHLQHQHTHTHTHTQHQTTLQQQRDTQSTHPHT